MDPITVYISIGNSDDKLTQAEWARYIAAVRVAIQRADTHTHGEWYSAPGSPYQNACWCIEITPGFVELLEADLLSIAYRFRQDSIAWATATTEFLKPAEAAP